MIESEWLDRYEALEALEDVEKSDLNGLGSSLDKLILDLKNSEEMC